MPFTPFHFGPSSCIAFPLQKYIDVPVFIFANIVVDIEPLIVIALNLNYPLHGYVHTFLIGSVVGIAWAIFSYAGQNIFQWIMKKVHLPYNTNFKKILISALLGVWFHVLLDAPIYFDIRPFYPFASNPLYGLMTNFLAYIVCGISFIPAVILYLYLRERS